MTLPILYSFRRCPYAMRARLALWKAGVSCELREVVLRDKPPSLLEYSPKATVPVLVLDDGTVIAESLSICRYLEELHPEPPLFGRNAAERGVVDMWLRRFELDGFIPMLHAVRNHVPMFAGRVVPGTRNDLSQLPAMVSRGKQMMAIFLDRIEPHLAVNEFVAGEAFTVADITGFFTLRMTAALQMDIEASNPASAAWFARIFARPAFQL